MAIDETGARILDAALEMISRYGYAGATTRKIAAAAGVNEVTLFRKFGTKQHLVQAAIRQQVARFDDIGIAYTGDLVSDLTAIVEFYLQLVQQWGKLLPALYADLPRHPELRPMLEEGPVYVLGHIMQIIRRYQERGLLLHEPPVHTLTALLGPVVVRGVFHAVEMPLALPETDAARHVEHFLHGRLAAVSQSPDVSRKEGAGN